MTHFSPLSLVVNTTSPAQYLPVLHFLAARLWISSATCAVCSYPKRVRCCYLLGLSASPLICSGKWTEADEETYVWFLFSLWVAGKSVKPRKHCGALVKAAGMWSSSSCIPNAAVCKSLGHVLPSSWFMTSLGLGWFWPCVWVLLSFLWSLEVLCFWYTPKVVVSSYLHKVGGKNARWWTLKVDGCSFHFRLIFVIYDRAVKFYKSCYFCFSCYLCFRNEAGKRRIKMGNKGAAWSCPAKMWLLQPPQVIPGYRAQITDQTWLSVSIL